MEVREALAVVLGQLNHSSTISVYVCDMSE